MYPWLLNVYSDTVIIGMGRRRVRFQEEEEETGKCLPSVIQITWFCVVSRSKTYGQW